MLPRPSASSSAAYACSTYCDTISTAVSGARLRASRAARKPSSRYGGGRRMSTMATSGRSRSTA
jgi:hypothetical protein